ncbi:hypothetical protein CJO79_07410 [Ralstonia solanacearum]|nr:hypothetical protein CJO76_07425 [Ralstonia solanacearum]AXV92524.1 hypothetical protein CJO79_07410 [Ralstonia solanacearum]AXW77415.1 hypothetical protein CJO97_07405 [Ralstonia solanacearum]
MVPSKASEFLRRFTGKKVARLVRYSWWPAEEVGTQCGIRDEQAFSLTAGPLVVHFEDGAILGLASDSSLNSVIVWDETARRAGHGSSSLDTDDELFAISESGPFAGGCWRQFVGLSLNGFTILRRATVSSKEGERPSEVGLRFKFDGGASFVASHGLHDNSDDFSVLEESQLLEVALKEIPIK